MYLLVRNSILIWSTVGVQCRKRRIKAAVVGVPKTIDNDIMLMDKTFGFDTAVEEAQRAINSAYIEVLLYDLLQFRPFFYSLFHNRKNLLHSNQMTCTLPFLFLCFAPFNLLDPLLTLFNWQSLLRRNFIYNLIDLSSVNMSQCGYFFVIFITSSRHSHHAFWNPARNPFLTESSDFFLSFLEVLGDQWLVSHLFLGLWVCSLMYFIFWPLNLFKKLSHVKDWFPEEKCSFILNYSYTLYFFHAICFRCSFFIIALLQAHSAYRGIGIVKLMGRSSGFIAMQASLASGQIDICLIPEVQLISTRCYAKLFWWVSH